MKPIRGLLNLVGRILRAAWVAVWVFVYCVGMAVMESARAMGGVPLDEHLEESEHVL